MSEPYVTIPPPTPPARKFPLVPVLIGSGVVLLAVLIGGGLLAYNFVFRRPNAIPQLLAADTQVYVAFTPNLSDVPNLDRLRRAFPTENDEPVDQTFNEQLEEQFGVTFESDIAPWLGGEVAFAVRDLPFEAIANPTDFDSSDLPSATDVLFVLASRNDGAAKAFLDKQRQHREGEGETFASSEVEGVTIYGQEDDEQNPLSAFALVRNHVVFASSPELISAMISRDPGGEETLERNPRFQAVRAALPESRLAYVYVDSAPIVQAIEAGSANLDQSASAQLEQQLEIAEALDGLGFALGAEATGFALDTVVGLDREQLPADAVEQIEEAAAGVSPDRIASVSKRALAALSFRIPTNIGETVREAIENIPDGAEQLESYEQSLDFDLDRDLLSWFHGEATLVLLPGETLLDSESPVTGYFALKPTDREAAEAGVERIIEVLENASGGELGLREEEFGGTPWQVVGPPDDAVAGYAFLADELIISVGPGAMASAAGADERLDGEAAFKTATTSLPNPNGGMIYVAMPAVLDLAEELGTDSDSIEGLRPFQAIAASGSAGLDDNGFARSRIFISVAPEE